jgi:DNA (cytosine-5)-methyltransferase 1
MCRVIGEFQPEWVIAENVRGLLTQGGGVVFERVCTDLEALGYEVQPIVIPAVAVNAPHRRDRIWFVAHRKSSEPRQSAKQERWKDISRGNSKSNAPDSERERGSKGARQSTASRARKTHPNARSTGWGENWLEVATRLCRVDDGLPRRLDRNPRLKALGNAIVPQVAEEIMKAIARP